MDTISRRQLQAELRERSSISSSMILQEVHQVAFIEQKEEDAANNPKAIDMISASSTNDVVTVAEGAAKQLDATIRTSHNDDDDDDDDDDVKPTHIDTVTLKCDLNDYLINLTNVRCSLPPRNAIPSTEGSSSSSSSSGVGRDNISLKYPGRHRRTGHSGGPTYTHFDELVRCTEREREWLRRGLTHRLRLCGGGEDSINNGTSAWGTPPGASSNGTLNAWGVLPNQQQQQQQQQQQPLAPSAWGNVNNNSNPGNNNNNSTGSNTGSNGNGGNVVQQRGGPSATDPNSNKANAQPTSAPNAWNATVNHGRHAAANVANNNGGNHPHGHNNNSNNSSQQQQQQQQQQAANMGANNNNGAAKNQLEVLSTMRDALFAQDGWGCQHVNQDTNWEVPGSPEPQGAASAPVAKPEGAHGTGPNGSWKAQTMNNGTELWETNLRSGGGGPHLQQQQQAQQHLAQAKTTPWVPANNLGGTWMEDEEVGGAGGGGASGVVPDATANVWNGSAAAIVAGTVPLGGPTGGGPASVGPAPSWGNGNVVTAAAPSASAATVTGGGMWPTTVGNTAAITTTPAAVPNNPQMAAIGVKKDLNEWGAGAGAGGPVVGAVGSGGPGIPAQGGWGDGRSANQSAAGNDGLRGDPGISRISGRLNGAAAGSMWGGGGGGAGVPDQRAQQQQQWGGNGSGGPAKGWDDGRPSSLDEATVGGGALWGQGNAVGGGAGGPTMSRQNSAGWKDVSDVMMRPGGGVPGGGSGGPMQRNQQFGPVPVPSGGGGVRGSLAKDGMWGGGQQQVPGIVRNGSWEDSLPGGGGGWGDEKGGAPWNMELAANGGTGWNKTPTTPKSAGIGWPDPNDLTGGGGMDWGLAGKPTIGGSNKPPSAMNNPLEFIRASKEYRLLCEMGHKKEEVEFALRTTSMNIDEAMELLRHGASGGVVGLSGGWRRTLSEDHTSGGGGGLGMGFDGPYSGRIPPTLNHAAPSGLSYSQNNQNMLNNLPGGGGLGLDGSTGGPANHLMALNNLKYLSQGAGGGGGGGGPSFNHGSLLPPGSRGPANQQPQAAHQQQQQQLAAAAAAQPTNQQLRALVHQITLAVQSGFLNHQILNQPLAPQTFHLLNQLLTHIKQMQITQSNLARSGATAGVSAVQMTLAINKHKTQIAQLQQQIGTAQSIYLKQQQGHQGSMGPPPPPPLMGAPGTGMDFMRQQQLQPDLMALQSTFGEMGLGKDPIITSTGSVFPPPVVNPLQQQQQQQQQHAVVSAAAGNNNGVVVSGSTSQQSRLNQWKLPSLEKDPTAGKDDLTDFSRAPGPSGSKSALTTTTTSTNISSLGLVQDGTWTTGRTNLTDGGWPEQTGDSDSKDWTTATNVSSQDSSAFTDLVPEFEPGKPWKGTQLKIEDDPSITPGSVARSPLSIATAKESELFGGASVVAAAEKASSPTSGVVPDLTSSAWSFNAPASATGTKPPLAGKSVWSDSAPGGGGSGNGGGGGNGNSDVWCTPIAKPSATRGPPPGLGGTAGNKNGNGGGTVAGTQRGAGWSTGGGTSWLLLKNFTSQIDASTLRTLCMQHGPILNFHAYPAHRLALCRYGTREEAAKAQLALNNCTLGTSTISAECPTSESEVQTYLQQLGGAGAAATSSATSLTSPTWRQERTSGSSGADTWGSGWALGGSSGSSADAAANLWAPLDGGADSGTPTSLNSFLPDSLLGPELN